MIDGFKSTGHLDFRGNAGAGPSRGSRPAAMSRPTRAAFIVTIAAALSLISPANSADMGGSCCADLEERIAELEETAVRKGNRKVTLTVSGQISQGLLAWHDGEQSNAYIVSNSNSTGRFRFSGDGQINADFSAGYYLEFSIRGSSSAAVDQLNDDPSDHVPAIRQSLWYLRSKSLGAFTMGLGAPATDGVIGYNLGSTGVAADSDAAAVGAGLFTRDSSLSGRASLNALSSGNTISLRWRRFVEGLDTDRANIIRYDSPIFHGVTVSASWGEDDFWDVAARFAKKAAGFRLAAGVGYYRQTDEEEDTFAWPRGGDNENASGNTIVSEWKGSASVIHEDSGLFVSGAYVHREFEGSDLGVVNFACFSSPDAAAIRALGIECDNRPDFDYYWVSGGIKRKFNDLGWTSIYGEYAQSQDAITGLNVSVQSAAGGDLDFVTSSTMEMLGAGIVQHVSQADLDLFVSYRHFEARVKGFESTGEFIRAPIDDADIFFSGARIKF